MASLLGDSKRKIPAAIPGLLAGYFLLGMQASPSLLDNHASAQATAQGTPPRDSSEWEYKTSSIDACSLQSMLSVLGTDHWEVFSVASTDAIIDTGSDGKSHVVTQRFEVTAKRKRQ